MAISKLQEFLWVMRQVKFLLLRDETDSPLLHRQGAEENLYWSAVLVRPNPVGYHRVRRHPASFDLGFKKRCRPRLLGLPSERASERDIES